MSIDWTKKITASEQAAQALESWRSAARVTNGRARIMLRKNGKMNAVQQAIKNLGPDVQQDVQDLWEYEPFIHRNDELVELVRQQAGMTPEEMDTLFEKEMNR